MPSSMCWPCARLAPAHERVGVVAEPVDAVAQGPDPGPVDPAAQVGRRGHVGADGHDARRHLGRVVREVDEHAPERLLGRDAARMRAAQLDRRRRRGLRRGHVAPQPLRRGRAQLRLGAALGRRAPRVLHVGGELARQLLQLLVGQQGRVVARMAGDRQPPALDRVGEHDRGPVGDRLGPLVGLEQRGVVVAAEVAQRGQQHVVGQLVHDAARRRRARRRRPAAARAARRRRRAAGAGTRRCSWRRCAPRRPSPPGRPNRPSSSRPYLTTTTCHPAASNMVESRSAVITGTTRSSDWRLKSTIHSTSPSRATSGSTSASHTAPSSSSASPTIAMWRPPTGTSTWPAR